MTTATKPPLEKKCGRCLDLRRGCEKGLWEEAEEVEEEVEEECDWDWDWDWR